MQPDDSIGYWLSYAQRCFSSAFSEVLRTLCVEQGKAYVITPPQWGILSFIAHKQEQTIGALAQRLGVDAPAARDYGQRGFAWRGANRGECSLFAHRIHPTDGCGDPSWAHSTPRRYCQRDRPFRQ
jgi:hypothetical protein